jgi:hypothetical protein
MLNRFLGGKAGGLDLGALLQGAKGGGEKTHVPCTISPGPNRFIGGKGGGFDFSSLGKGKGKNPHTSIPLMEETLILSQAAARVAASTSAHSLASLVVVPVPQADLLSD